MSIVSTILVKDYDVLFGTFDDSAEEKTYNITKLINRQFSLFSINRLNQIHDLLFAKYLEEDSVFALSGEYDELVFKFIEDLEREFMSRVDLGSITTANILV